MMMWAGGTSRARTISWGLQRSTSQFGLSATSEDQQADLYEIINKRYERASTILSSNRDFSEWPAVFSNPLMGSAAMDRLVHRA